MLLASAFKDPLPFCLSQLLIRNYVKITITFIYKLRLIVEMVSLDGRRGECSLKGPWFKPRLCQLKYN